MLKTLALIMIVAICSCPNPGSVVSNPNSIKTPAVDFFLADEERPFNLTITSNEVSEPIEIDNGTIVNSDRIRLNAFFHDDVVNPENDIVNVSMTTQTGFLLEASDLVYIDIVHRAMLFRHLDVTVASFRTGRLDPDRDDVPTIGCDLLRHFKQPRVSLLEMMPHVDRVRGTKLKGPGAVM